MKALVAARAGFALGCLLAVVGVGLAFGCAAALMVGGVVLAACCLVLVEVGVPPQPPGAEGGT